MTRKTLSLVLGALLAAACGSDEPAARQSPPSTQSVQPLMPLSAHGDEAPPPPAPGPAASLPPGHPRVDQGRAPAPPLPETGAVTGTVALLPSLKGHVASTDSLFIIARSAKDRQILAVRKEENVHLPFAFTISGANAMMEGTPFVGPFDLTARLSKSGDATPGAGDLEGTARGVAAGARNVSIVLDSVRQ